MSRLYRIEIDEAGLPVPSPEMDQERRVAVFDLEESNSFDLVDGPDGPYALNLGMQEGRAVFDLSDREEAPAGRFTLAIGPLRQTIKDYADLCDSYVEAVKTLPPARIEAIDTARREIHLEGARQLQARLTDKARVDEATARRLFTLICAMVRID